MSDKELDLDVELIKRRLASAGAEIASSGPPAFLGGRKSGWRLGAVALAIAAVVATTSAGFAAGRVTAPPVGSHVHIASLPALPPDVQQALDSLQQQMGADFVANVTSAETKYVTDTQFWHSIYGAWMHSNASECNTFLGPSGALGHVYAVVLRGQFSWLDHPGGAPVQSFQVEVLLVRASDWRLDLSQPGNNSPPLSESPAPLGLTQSAQALGVPPLGPDGEPLCWSSLPSQ